MSELPTEGIRQMRKAVDELTDSLMQMAWALGLVEKRVSHLLEKLPVQPKPRKPRLKPE